MTWTARVLLVSAAMASFTLDPPAVAATNGIFTNDLRWAQIVLKEEIFPSAGFLGMVSAFTDGTRFIPVRNDASADLPWGSPAVGGPTDFKTIREKYGPPSSTTNAGGTVAQTLQRKPRRTVSYHWYGAMAFITERGQESVIGLALRGDLLKTLEREPDLRLAAERCLDADRKQTMHASCQRALRQLDDAKRRWATDTGKTEGDIPFASHITDELPGRSMPECPQGGIYRFNLVGKRPDCSVHGNGWD